MPEFDEDGNQLYIQTETANWALNYNAANRPTDFSCMDEEGNFLTVKCDYDFMGRRVFKKVIRGNSTVISHQRFIYRGYLQIACVDLTRTNHPALWLITWDPTQPIATRPLAIQKDGTWYTYGLDLTKNVCEVFGATGYIRTAYTYSPYGEVTTTGNVDQPIQWSSEFNDEELGLVYYNWRYYNELMGRWGNRDIVEYSNLYTYCFSSPISIYDIQGKEFKHIIERRTLSSILTAKNRIAYTGSGAVRSNIEKRYRDYNQASGAKKKEKAFLWFKLLYGLKEKQSYNISNCKYYGPQYDMKIITYLPRDLKRTFKGSLQLIRHEANRVYVYKKVYEHYIKPLADITCDVSTNDEKKQKEIYDTYTIDLLHDMLFSAHRYASTQLGDSERAIGINAENKYAIYINRNEKIGNLQFANMLKTDYETAMQYRFDGFGDYPLYMPVPPPISYIPIKCPK